MPPQHSSAPIVQHATHYRLNPNRPHEGGVAAIYRQITRADRLPQTHRASAAIPHLVTTGWYLLFPRIGNQSRCQTDSRIEFRCGPAESISDFPTTNLQRAEVSLNSDKVIRLSVFSSKRTEDEIKMNRRSVMLTAGALVSCWIACCGLRSGYFRLLPSPGVNLCTVSADYDHKRHNLTLRPARISQRDKLPGPR